MESLHVIIPSMTSDPISYDVINPLHASHHHHHESFWHPPTPPPPPDHNEQRCHGNDGGAFRQADRNKVGQGQAHEQPVFQELRPAVRRMSPSSTLVSGEGDDRNDAKKIRTEEWSSLPEVALGVSSDGGHGDNSDTRGHRDGQGKTTHDDKDSQGNKESQMAATLRWLSENYELSEGVCLPRCVLYLHYQDFCKRGGMTPSGAATFGKLIRQKFKSITTRRLGTRGQSKYHYYGLGIQETSIYYQSVYTGRGLTRFSGTKIKTEGSARKYSLSSKTGTLLPEFPRAKNLILPDAAPTTEQMETFIMMYRTHCQRILDTVIATNFDEIQNLLVHFWQGFPTHLIAVLQVPDPTCDVIAICDSILYKVLLDVLVPNSIQELPDSLLTDLRMFLKSLPRWIQTSMDDLIPQRVKDTKQQAVQSFLKTFKRQLAFVSIAQTARSHLSNSDVTSQAVRDLESLDFPQICGQTRFALSHTDTRRDRLAMTVLEDLKTLLRHQSQIEAVIEWMDGLLDTHVITGESKAVKFRERVGPFLLHWSLFGAVLVKDLTLSNAKSFTFLHLLKLTMDEYLFLVLDTHADRDRDDVLKTNLQSHMTNAENIPMTATTRNRALRTHRLSPKPKKRKADVMDAQPADDRKRNFAGADGGIGTTRCNNNHLHHTHAHCLPQQLDTNIPPTSTSPALPTTLIGPDHNRPSPTPLRTTAAATIIPTTTHSPPSQTTPTSIGNTATTPHLKPPVDPSGGSGDLLVRPTPHHNMPLPPMTYYPSYTPSLGLNSYSDYLTHHHNPPPPPPPPPQPTRQSIHSHAQSHPFQPIGFSSTVNQTHPTTPTYWTDNRFHPAPYPAPYHAPYTAPYTKHLSPLLRPAMYHTDTLTCASLNPDAYPRGNIETFQLSGASLEGFQRQAVGFPMSVTSSASHDDRKPTGSFCGSGRTHGDYQVGQGFSVGPLGQGRLSVTSPGSPYAKQEGLFYYTEDPFTSNMANSSISGFGKSYLPTSFR